MKGVIILENKKTTISRRAIDAKSFVFWWAQLLRSCCCSYLGWIWRWALPFGRSSLGMDIGIVISAITLGYLSWTTFRDTEVRPHGLFLACFGEPLCS